MKKLMIIVAVCAMASVVQAYSVNWSATNVRIPVADDPKVSQTGIKTTSSGDTPSTPFDAGALTLSLFYVDSSGEEQLVKSMATEASGKLADEAVPVIEFNDTLYKAILADQDGDAVQFVMRATYSTKDGTYDFYINKTGVDITGLDTSNKPLALNMNNGSWNYTASAVPEPTSGLLLLLGVAGLALRRRRA